MGWLLRHSVSKERVDKEPTKVRLELYMEEAKLPPAPAGLTAGQEQPSPLLPPGPRGEAAGAPRL